MSTILNKITSPVQSELTQVEEEIRASLKSDNRLINEISGHLMQHRGKRLRPVLLLLSNGMTGKITETSIRLAAIVELLHTATLIHDDVVDNADLRRNGPSVNFVWDNKTAVLMGDFLYATVLRNLARLKEVRIIDIVANAVRELSTGELIQMQNQSNVNLDEDTYFDLISKKTGFLMATTCRLGALVSSNGDKSEETLSLFGKHLGIAFQIKDDLLDLNGTVEQTGKPIIRDLIENTFTLPLIHALGKSSDPKMVALIKNGIPLKNIPEVCDFIKKSEGIAYAQSKAEAHATIARECLASYPDSEYKHSLEILTSFITDRNR